MIPVIHQKTQKIKRTFQIKRNVLFLKSARYNGCPGDSEDPGLINYSDGK